MGTFRCAAIERVHLPGASLVTTSELLLDAPLQRSPPANNKLQKPHASVCSGGRCHRKRVAQIVVAQWRRFMMLRRAADRGACHRQRWLLRAGLESLRSAAAQVCLHVCLALQHIQQAVCLGAPQLQAPQNIIPRCALRGKLAWRRQRPGRAAREACPWTHTL